MLLGVMKKYFVGRDQTARDPCLRKKKENKYCEETDLPDLTKMITLRQLALFSKYSFGCWGAGIVVERSNEIFTALLLASLAWSSRFSP